MPKYRKKPIVVEAIQWTGSNLEEIRNFVGSDLIENYIEHFDIERTLIKQTLAGIAINTLEGTMMVNYGDYIIKGVNNEFYPCKPDIFEQTYEEVIDDNKEQKETYLSKYLRENNCSYEEFVKDQEMYDGFCPVILESP
ncbi:hypothetical protein, partial [Enterobacter asburiae]